MIRNFLEWKICTLWRSFNYSRVWRERNLHFLKKEVWTASVTSNCNIRYKTNKHTLYFYAELSDSPLYLISYNIYLIIFIQSLCVNTSNTVHTIFSLYYQEIFCCKTNNLCHCFPQVLFFRLLNLDLTVTHLSTYLSTSIRTIYGSPSSQRHIMDDMRLH